MSAVPEQEHYRVVVERPGGMPHQVPTLCTVTCSGVVPALPSGSRNCPASLPG